MFHAVAGSLRRFPFVFIAAAAALGLSWGWIWIPRTPASDVILGPALLTALLAVPLFLGAALMSERRLSPRNEAFFMGAIGLALGFFHRSFDPSAPAIFVYRFWQYLLAASLFVTVAPFCARGSAYGFWQYNRLLFKRLLLSGLAALLLFGGVAGALLAARSLLELRIPANLYACLYATCMLLVAPWIFLSRIPTDWDLLEGHAEYPASLRRFEQFIAIPLVSLFGGVLYAYGLRSAIFREWPRGTMGPLVLGVALAGLLNILFLWPLRERLAWARRTAPGMSAALLPLAGLLVMAVLRRISEYGLTEERFFLVALAFWIAALATYFFFRPGGDIRWAPVSLAILSLMTSAGPLSAYAWSRQDQRHRLAVRLERLNILKSGQVEKAVGKISFDDRRAVSESVDYLMGMHGISTLQPWFIEPLVVESSALDPASLRAQPPNAESIVERLGIPYLQPADRHSAEGFHAELEREEWVVRSIRGFDYWYRFRASAAGRDAAPAELRMEGRTYEVVLSSAPAALSIVQGPRRLLDMPLAPYLEAIAKRLDAQTQTAVPEHLMTIEAETGSLRIKLVMESLTGRRAPSAIELERIQGELYLSLKTD